MVDPKKIKITLPIPVGGGGSGSSVAWMFLHGLTVEKSAERSVFERIMHGAINGYVTKLHK